jgi:solute carrier family 45 protein 1/2/4
VPGINSFRFPFPEDHTKIMSFSTVMGGIGGFTGYLLGGIDWAQTSFGQFLGGHMQTIFSINTVVFAICLLCTITSNKEVPRTFLKKHGLLKYNANDEETVRLT